MQGEDHVFELKGINRSTSVLRSADGSCEDLVNLFFKDGSWRSCNLGEKVFDMGGTRYVQLYVHTNVYSHLLGVRDGWLWWFADIDADDRFTLRETAVRLCEVSGEMHVSQTGHLLTVTDGEGRCSYLLYYSVKEEYREFDLDYNGKRDDAVLLPDGLIRFRMSADDEFSSSLGTGSGMLGDISVEMAVADISNGRDKARAGNVFVSPFLVCTALELYDGSHILMGRPQLMNPCAVQNEPGVGLRKWHLYVSYGKRIGGDANYSKMFHVPKSILQFQAFGSRLKQYSDLFVSIGIFVTPEYDLFSLENARVSLGTDPETGNTSTTHGEVYMRSKSSNEKAEAVKFFNNSLFYNIARYDINRVSGEWMDVTLDDGVLSNLVHRERLDVGATSRDTYLPAYSFTYNGRLHMANYKSLPFHGWPIGYFDYPEKRGEGQYDAGVLHYRKNPYLSVSVQDHRELAAAWNEAAAYYRGKCIAKVEVDIDTGEDVQTVCRCIVPKAVSDEEVSGLSHYSSEEVRDLMPMLSYPDRRAKEMRFYYVQSSLDEQGNWETIVFDEECLKVTLRPHGFYDFAYAIEPKFKPYSITGNMSTDLGTQFAFLLPAQLPSEHVPNGLRVSEVDNPLYFPPKNTYLAGSSEIVGMASNAIAVGTGQTGSSPLCVFCKDGVYALFVDSSGEVVYRNARPIARDVCNNARSIVSTDMGVVFTTERGLMCLSGNEVLEIGQPPEGDVLRFFDASSPDYIKVASNALGLSRVAGIKSVGEDFIDYLRGSIIGYNHSERELLVGNPGYDFTYAMDRWGNWTRKDFRSEEFVDNYPTSYRLSGGVLYDLNREGDAGAGVFFLSRPLKLGNTGFKQAYRFIARGRFDTQEVVSRSVQESVRGVGGLNVVLLVLNSRTILPGSVLLNIDPGRVYRYVVRCNKASVKLYVMRKNRAGMVQSRELTGEGYLNAGGTLDVSFSLEGLFGDFDATFGDVYTLECYTPEGYESDVSTRVYEADRVLGCYVFGSYDGERWAFVGGNEKSGSFTDMGCQTVRMDCRFFRVCVAGFLSTDSRLDYMEMTADGSRLLGGKVR